MRLSSHLFLPVCWAMALASCAAPKAIIVAEENPTPVPAPGKPGAQAEEQASIPEEPALPGTPDDGIRLPNMLELPGEGEFRPTNPGAPNSGADPGAVISRPPTDPPSRPKPKEKPAE